MGMGSEYSFEWCEEVLYRFIIGASGARKRALVY